MLWQLSQTLVNNLSLLSEAVLNIKLNVRLSATLLAVLLAITILGLELPSFGTKTSETIIETTIMKLKTRMMT